MSGSCCSGQSWCGNAALKLLAGSGSHSNQTDLLLKAGKAGKQ